MNNIGMVKKQAGMITDNNQNDLWGKGILSEENPDQLHSTVLFLLGLNLGLRGGDEHYALRRLTTKVPNWNLSETEMVFHT